MNEYSLHSEIKTLYAIPGDQVEAKLGNYIVDILRGELAIEVQTKNFSALKKKLQDLTGKNQVRLVYPLPERKWVTRVTESGTLIRKRKSTKKGKLVDVFRELVMIPTMLGEENFSLEVLLIDEEEVVCADGKGSWRRRGVSTIDRKLLRINGRVLFQSKADYLKVLPDGLGEVFYNREIAKKANISLRAARQITYCLRKSGIIRVVDKKKRALLFKKD